MTPAAKTLPNAHSVRNISSHINIILCLLNPIFILGKKITIIAFFNSI